MSDPKPFTEVLAGVFANSLNKSDPGQHGSWAELSSEKQAELMSGMADVIGLFGIFRIGVAQAPDGSVRLVSLGQVVKQDLASDKTEADASVLAPSVQRKGLSTSLGPTARDYAVARASGYEGDSCMECGAMTMVRNGSCLKCMSCGGTSGCS